MDHVIEYARPRWEWLKMRFNSEISLGSLLNMMAIVGGGVLFLLSYEHRMTKLEDGQEQVERRLGDQESQMRTFQIQLGKLLMLPVAKGQGNEFSQTPPP